MKKAKSELSDWGRPEYKRSDFGEVVRGKYANRLNESPHIVLLDDDVARAFPNSKAVNKALRTLMSTKHQEPKSGSRNKRRSTSTTKKPRAA